ncbi:MAG: GNAT family N-acetyltransferase [Chloroflexi bacterium]|nr:GNAT family N-acetyltransferase [Chloroflexota bacterium]
MHSTIHTSSQALHDHAAAWELLHAQSPTATLFNHPRWTAVWWKHFGHEGDLRLITVEDDAGELVGLAPFYVDREEGRPPLLRLLGGTEVCDYLDVLVSPGREAETGQALFDCWASDEDLCPPVLDLHSIPEASPTGETFRLQAAQRGYAVEASTEDVCPVIFLPDSWDGYLASLSKKQRHEVRRKRRKAEAQADVSWHFVEQADELPEAIETFITLHQLSSKGKEDFMSPKMKDFFRDLATTSCEAGWLKLAILYLDGRPAASYFCFDYRNHFMVYNSGYDPSLAPELSPGIVLIVYCIEEAIRLGRSHFDFLRGDEPYKFRLGANPTHIHQMTIHKE